MRFRSVLSIVLSTLLLAACGGKSNPEAEKAAVTAAKEWLAALDAGGYPATWESAAAYFKAALSPEDWARTAGAARAPLGAVQSREVSSTNYATALPGAPDGEYVVIRFKTVFEHKKSAIETVTPMRDADGVWRVSGYFIN